MIHQLLGSLPKAAAIALGSVAIIGGAVGAAASAGGGDVPGPVNTVFSALGFGIHADSDEDSATATPRAHHKATATGTALPGKDMPSTSSIPGLCRAYGSGSERGRERKVEATAFKRLQNAASAAGQDLDDFCDDVLAARKGTPVATGTATSGTTQSGQSAPSKGKPESHGNSDEHRPGYSPAGAASHSSGVGTVQETRGKTEASSGNGASAPNGNAPERR